MNFNMGVETMVQVFGPTRITVSRAGVQAKLVSMSSDHGLFYYVPKDQSNSWGLAGHTDYTLFLSDASIPPL